jgi:hypothetical protein
MNRVAAPN